MNAQFHHFHHFHRFHHFDFAFGLEALTYHSFETLEFGWKVNYRNVIKAYAVRTAMSSP